MIIILFLNELQDQQPCCTTLNTIEHDDPLAVDIEIETSEKGIEQQYTDEVVCDVVDPIFLVLKILFEQAC